MRAPTSAPHEYPVRTHRMPRVARNRPPCPFTAFVAHLIARTPFIARVNNRAHHHSVSRGPTSAAPAHGCAPTTVDENGAHGHVVKWAQTARLRPTNFKRTRMAMPIFPFNIPDPQQREMPSQSNRASGPRLASRSMWRRPASSTTPPPRRPPARPAGANPVCIPGPARADPPSPRRPPPARQRHPCSSAIGRSRRAPRALWRRRNLPRLRLQRRRGHQAYAPRIARCTNPARNHRRRAESSHGQHAAGRARFRPQV